MRLYCVCNIPPQVAFGLISDAAWCELRHLFSVHCCCQNLTHSAGSAKWLHIFTKDKIPSAGDMYPLRVTNVGPHCRGGFRSEARYIVSEDSALTKGVGWATSLAGIMKFSKLTLDAHTIQHNTT